MTFDRNKTYKLESVTDRRCENPLHDRMLGKRCMLGVIEPEGCGWIEVEMDDGWHTVRTSHVKSCDVVDDGRTVIMRTENSTYRFWQEEEQNEPG